MGGIPTLRSEGKGKGVAEKRDNDVKREENTDDKGWNDVMVAEQNRPCVELLDFVFDL